MIELPPHIFREEAGKRVTGAEFFYARPPVTRAAMQ
jgi:hypothetical protein